MLPAVLGVVGYLRGSEGICPMRGKIFGFFVRHKKLALGAVVIYGIVKYRNYKNMKKMREEWTSAGQDVVVVHTVPPSRFCPDASPFSMKLLTYLKMADIRFQIDTRLPMGKKGKLPWITLNGEDYCDSQFIIEHLNGVFEKNFNMNLSSSERAVARAFRIMVEEHLLWGLAYWRYVEDSCRGMVTYFELPFFMKFILLPFFKKEIRKVAYAQGTGRHTVNEIHQIMIQNLAAISNQIGQKKFLMGDEPCEEDCAVFGMLSQLRWQSPGSPYTTAIKENYKNLDEYCNRMKSRFWPDWNDYLLK